MGYHVTGIDNFLDYYPRKQKDANIDSFGSDANVRFMEKDLLDVDMNDLLSDVDVVFHQAAQAGVRASWGENFDVYIQNNIKATQRLLESVKDKHIKKFVYASSSSVYGDALRYPVSEDEATSPISPYGVTKLAGEHLCRLYWKSYNVPIVALRYFTVYGPRQRPDMAFHKFIKDALEGKKTTIYGDGQQTRDFTYIDDAVEANILASKKGINGSVYNIGGGSRISVKEVLDIISDSAGKKLEVDYTDPQRGDVRHTFADTGRAQKDLGFCPNVNICDGIASEIKWVREYYGI